MLSTKQKQVISLYSAPPEQFAMYCMGAVRSGKSYACAKGLALLIVNTNYYDFCIAGVTIPQIVGVYSKEIISTLNSLGCSASITKRFGTAIEGYRPNGTPFIIDIIPGKDISGTPRIQGRTFGGMIIDEILNLNEDFVNMAVSRLSLPKSKLWVTYNPTFPLHWFKTKWEDRATERSAQKVHFLFDDNPSLDPKYVERTLNDYTGIDYKRFVLGEWCGSDGLIYGEWHRYTDQPSHGAYYASFDYGMGSVFAGLLFLKTQGISYIIDEFYYNAFKDGVISENLMVDKLCRWLAPYRVKKSYCDPASNPSFKLLMRQRGHNVINAINDVNPGIGVTSTALQKGKILVGSHLKNFNQEILSYSWDEDKPDDTPIKENDHLMDALRYYAMMKHKKFNIGSLPKARSL